MYPSRFKAGEKLEREFSSSFHATELPVLVSPLLLRSINCGQLDFVRMEKQSSDIIIKIVEVKSRSYLSAAQMVRLRRSQQFLAYLFKKTVLLDYLFDKKGEV